MKKIYITAVLSLFASLGIAYAQNGGDDMRMMMPLGANPMVASSTMPMKRMEGAHMKVARPDQVLEVNGRGDVLLRGTVTAVNTDSISVKSWGGVWTIKQGQKTSEVISQDKTLATFAVGDYVGVKGRIMADQTLTIEGNVIRNRSFDENKFKKMEDQMKKMMSGQNDRREGRPEGSAGSSTMPMSGDHRPMPPMPGSDAFRPLERVSSSTTIR